MRRNIHVLCGGIYRYCIVDNALLSNLFKKIKQNKTKNPVQCSRYLHKEATHFPRTVLMLCLPSLCPITSQLQQQA